MANAFKRKLARDIGTTATTIGSYTVPASTQVTVIGLTVANLTAAQVDVDVTIVDSGAAITHLVKDAPVPVGSTLIVVGGNQKVVLEPGDTVQVTSSAATSVDAIMSILEIT